MCRRKMGGWALINLKTQMPIDFLRCLKTERREQVQDWSLVSIGNMQHMPCGCNPSHLFVLNKAATYQFPIWFAQIGPLAPFQLQIQSHIHITFHANSSRSIMPLSWIILSRANSPHPESQPLAFFLLNYFSFFY